MLNALMKKIKAATHPVQPIEEKYCDCIKRCPFCGASLKSIITTTWTARGNRGCWTEEYACGTKRKFVVGHEPDVIRTNECISKEHAPLKH